MRYLLSLVALTSLCIEPFLQAAEVKEQTVSHLILGLGPEYSTADNPDFVALRGQVNPYFYNYQSLSSSAGCVLQTSDLAFGSSATAYLRLGARVNAKIYWRGSPEEFVQNRTFVLRMDAAISSGGGPSRWVTAERELLISSLPHRQALAGGQGYIASTDNKWVWFSFNPFEFNGELSSGRLSICNISAEQNLYISEIEVELSHRLAE